MENRLKWAHFLGYFLLWGCAVLMSVQGIALLTGASYRIQAVDVNELYAKYPACQIIDYSYAVIMISLAVFEIYTAISIIRYKQKAGLFVCAIYILWPLASILYLICLSIIGGRIIFDQGIIIRVIYDMVMFFANGIYFNSRKDVFIN